MIRMKGGINMSYKKISAYALLGLITIQFIFAITLVSAQTAGAGKAITEPTWVVSIAKFMGFINADNNVTWAVIIASIAVLAMIFAATYDILAFTAFESKWVKMVIAGAIALVVAVADGITYLTAIIMSIAGGSVAIGTTIAIIVAVVFFVISTFLKGRVQNWKHRKEKEDAKRGFMDARNAIEGLKNIEKGASKKEK